MQKLFIKETLNSPKVLFDPSKKRYEITGKSFPENSKTFYQPVIDWINEIPSETTEKIQLSLDFDYISSSSVISVKQLLTKIKDLCAAGANIQVLWHYDTDDPDIKEIGEEYEKLLRLGIQMVENTNS